MRLLRITNHELQMIEFSFRTRAQNIKTLKERPLDLLVIGGGIVGAGLIRELALNGGINAGLIEQGDFASGTSNATSELVHGGFRYLLKRDIALVKEARQEREILLKIAPNLVKPLPIAILNYKGEPYPLFGIHLAAQYYNHLSKADRAEKAYILRNRRKIQHLIGGIETKGLKGCVIIWDSTVDDARLTLLTIKSAHHHGAIVANYVRFLNFIAETSSNRIRGVVAENTVSGERFEIYARKIVVATGPWTDKIWQKDPTYDGHPKLTTKKAKGTHLLFPRIGGSEYGVLAFTQTEKQSGGKPRVLFILPGEHNLSMVGTTESEPEADPANVRPSAAEIAYLTTEASRVFPDADISESNIVSAYSGVRPLVAAAGDGFVSREHTVAESPSGVLYIYGGKLTTYRKIGEELVDRIAEEFAFPRHRRTAEIQLLDEAAELHEKPDGLTETDRQRLLRRYGSGIVQLEQFIEQDVTLVEPLIETLPFLKAEILYGCWGEMVIRLEDFLWRRTRIGLTKGQGIPQALDIARWIGRACGWDNQRIRAEVEEYTERIRWLNAEVPRGH
jgi:glycerol-3-phosphate dehydrogenase